MLHKGMAKKLVVYVSSVEQYGNQPVYKAVVSFLHEHGCAGATVTKAVAGYGASGKLRKPKLFSIVEDMPMRIEAVDSEKKINALLPWIYEMVESGLIEVQDTEVVKSSAEKVEQGEEAMMKHQKLEGTAKMLRIHIGESDRWENEPLSDAIVKKLRMLDIAGATVYRGVSGYGAEQRVHQKSWFSLSSDLPVLITVIDTEEKIRTILPFLDEMVDDGLIALSDVKIIKYTHSVRGKNNSAKDDSV